MPHLSIYAWASLGIAFAMLIGAWALAIFDNAARKKQERESMRRRVAEACEGNSGYPRGGKQ
jgi:hypothetical protein